MNRFLVLISSLVLVSFLVLASATQLRANAIPDPNISMRDPLCSDGPCATLVGGPIGITPFTFASDAAGGGITTFEVDPANLDGFFTVDIETLGVFSVPPANCTSNKFVCTVTILDGAVTDMFFSTDGLGFPATDVFTINLNDPNGSLIDGGSWGSLHPFFAFPDVSKPLHALIPVPEPGTLALLAVGMAGLLACRKFTNLLGLRA